MIRSARREHLLSGLAAPPSPSTADERHWSPNPRCPGDLPPPTPPAAPPPLPPPGPPWAPPPKSSSPKTVFAHYMMCFHAFGRNESTCEPCEAGPRCDFANAGQVDGYVREISHAARYGLDGFTKWLGSSAGTGSRTTGFLPPVSVGIPTVHMGKLQLQPHIYHRSHWVDWQAMGKNGPTINSSCIPCGRTPFYFFVGLFWV